MSNLCPCGSEKEEDECCGAIISGKKKAQTAEQLMRSRYTAFTKANINYLVKTQVPSAGLRKEKERRKLKNWAQSVSWLYLAIKSTSKGLEDDDTGIVIFRAFFSKNDEYDNIYEESSFEKINGNWTYIDGVDLSLENEEKMFS